MANVGSGESGKTLIGAGNGASPTFASIGTNSGLTSHGVVISEGTSAFQSTSAGTVGQVLQSGGPVANPSYSATTYPSTSSQGDIIYASSNNVFSDLAKDTNATRYLSNTGTSNNPAWAQVNAANGVTGVLPVANGGLNSTGITGIVSGSGSAYAGRTITGTANQISVANGNGSSANPTLSFPATTVFATTQPYVLAYKSATTTNATGDGTVYTVIFDGEVNDQGSNYDNGTGVFTAPVTGNYLITGMIAISATGTSTVWTATVATTGQTFTCSSCNVANLGGAGFMWIPFTAMRRMTAGDVCFANIKGEGGTKNNTVFGAAALNTWISIVLLN